MIFTIRETKQEPADFIVVQDDREARYQGLYTSDDPNEMNPHHTFYSVPSFELFWRMARTPKEVLLSFIKNDVKYEDPQKTGKRPMYWPDDIIRNKVGNCLDFAVFMHFYFQKRGIEHALGFTINIGRTFGQLVEGHSFPIFRSNIDGNLWIWNYFARKQADINGPFKTYKEIEDEAGPYFSVLYNSETYNLPIGISPRDAVTPVTAIVDEDELKKYIDKAYTSNDRRTQTEITNDTPSIQKKQVEFTYYRDAIQAGNILRRTLQIFMPAPKERNIQAMFRAFSDHGK